MKLDDLKNTWEDLNNDQSHTALSQDDIEDFVKKHNFKNRIKSLFPEVIILLVYIYLIILLVAFNKHFSTTLLKSLSSICIIALLIQSYLIFKTSRLLYGKITLSDSYNMNLNKLKDECEKLNKNYRLTIFLNVIILLTCIVLIPAIYAEDLSSNQILISYIIGISCFGFLSYKIYGYYKNLISQNIHLYQKLFTDEK